MADTDEKEDEKDGNELVPIKIRRDTYRIIKTVAAWRGISALDYLDELIQREGPPDLGKVVDEINRLGSRRPRSPKK